MTVSARVRGWAKPLTLEEAFKSAKALATLTNCSVIVEQNTMKQSYHVVFTLSAFGKRIGERIYPEDSLTFEKWVGSVAVA